MNVLKSLFSDDFRDEVWEKLKEDQKYLELSEKSDQIEARFEKLLNEQEHELFNAYVDAASEENGYIFDFQFFSGVRFGACLILELMR